MMEGDEWIEDEGEPPRRRSFWFLVPIVWGLLGAAIVYVVDRSAVAAGVWLAFGISVAAFGKQLGHWLFEHVFVVDRRFGCGDEDDEADLPQGAGYDPQGADDPAYVKRIEKWAEREAQKEMLVTVPWALSCVGMIHGALIGPLFGALAPALDPLGGESGHAAWRGALLGLLIGPLFLSFVMAMVFPGLIIRSISGNAPTRRQRLAWAMAPFQIFVRLIMIGPRYFASIPRRRAERRFVERFEPLGVDFGHCGQDCVCGINFRGGPFGDDDLRGLRAFVGLDHLDLSGTRVTDALMPIVGKLRTMAILSLAGTAVTDNGLGHLVKCRRLRCLDLQGTRVSDVGVARLQQSLPRCKIVR